MPKFTVLHSFPDGPQDGTIPAGLKFGPDGNLYGVTGLGGSTLCNGSGCGTVFKLTPTAQGRWKETILHRFSGPDGFEPFAPIIFDPAGNIYGVTDVGGTGCGTTGCGTVFKMSPNTSGGYTATTLHRFASGSDGSYPVAVVLDATGNLFGVTLEGGNGNSQCSGGCGIAFELTPGTGGTWTYTNLHTFTYSGDGSLPSALTIDSAGNLFGAATFGEPGAEGSIYEISPVSGGGWNFNTLYLFSDPTTGGAPTAMILGADGNLYGTTETGGALGQGSGDGVVFEVVTSASSRN
jgi:uncharacterized repeat protein (TIGR03803 family)